VVEQLIRPTGLLDPQIEVRPASTQVDDLLGEIRTVTTQGWRVLVTTLTKRMAQELTDYFTELGVRCRYLHSDVDTLERMEILRELRLGDFDVLVGINLLREGLDLPEVALVAILDADKEGFLRSERSLIQTIGRAARNVEGRAVLYADRVTNSMARAIDETERRRAIQQDYNTEHGIVPRTVVRDVDDPLAAMKSAPKSRAQRERERGGPRPAQPAPEPVKLSELPQTLRRLRLEMKAAAEKLEFERAAEIRDRLRSLEQWAMEATGELPV